MSDYLIPGTPLILSNPAISVALSRAISKILIVFPTPTEKALSTANNCVPASFKASNSTNPLVAKASGGIGAKGRGSTLYKNSAIASPIPKSY